MKSPICEKEDIAKQYLEKLGWTVEKTSHSKYSKYGIGYPDFDCGGNGFVEVKAESGYSVIIFQLSQFDKMKELNKAGHTTYVLVLKNDNSIDMFNITYTNLMNKVRVPKET